MIPKLKVLGPSELRKIDCATKSLLWEVGIRVDHPEALELYRRAGAEVEPSRQAVRLPPRLVEEALRRCSPQVTLYAREGSPPLRVGGGRCYFGTTGFATSILDSETGNYRPALLEDVREAFRLAEVLDPPHFIMSSLTPTDVPPQLGDLYEFKEGLTNTRKHLIAQAQGAEHLRKMVAMALEVAGSEEALRARPFFSFLVCLTSPLVMRPDAAELIIEGARKGLPLFMESGPMCGATAPATLASTLIGANAELLSAIVLAKLVNPAVPLIYASWARIFDMRWATVSHGGPEFGLLRVATTQMARFYRLPSGGGGILADSRLIDAQLGLEKLSTALLPALAGTDMILGMGLLANENAFSPQVLMIDHEIAGYVHRVLRGIRWEDPATALAVFREIGPGGHFLDAIHTVHNFRKEMWLPGILERSGAVPDGKPLGESLAQRAKRALKGALEGYQPLTLPSEIHPRLEAIIHQ